MVDVDGMIGWLMQLMENTHTAMRNGRCREDSCTELVFVDCLRATESEQNPSRQYLFKSFSIEFSVPTQRILQGILMLCKSRRIQNDQVIDSLHLFQILEGIFNKSNMTGITRKIHLYVGIHQFYGLGTAVNGMHHLCTTTHGIHAESTRIAEHVEYASVPRIALHQATIVALINQMAGGQR